MLYELLAYRSPFDPNDKKGMLLKRLQGDPVPPLAKYLESYPLELDEIIGHALAANRDQRYSSAEEFAFDLLHVQERIKRDMVTHLVEDARNFIANSDFAKAQKLLSDVLRIDTQNATAKQLLYEIQQIQQQAARRAKLHQLRDQAKAALISKQLELAARLIEEAINLERADPEIMDLRDEIERAKSIAQQVKSKLTLANVAQEAGELQLADKAIKEALALDPDDTDAKLMEAGIARLLVERERQRPDRAVPASGASGNC